MNERAHSNDSADPDPQPNGLDERPVAEKRTPIVGIGASAGGLEAFKLILEHLPANTGFAVVLVQHLDPNHHSLLSELLDRVTAMPVTEVVDGTTAEANHVYVMPPNTELHLHDGKLRLTPRGSAAGPQLPIDKLLRSLAKELGSRAIGVILSGGGSDGSAGLRAIKEAGGITFAQAPETAEFTSMPTMAAAATSVDFVLSPRRIAEELVRISTHPFFDSPTAGDAAGLPADDFETIHAIMRDGTGVDFSLYREKTVHRRILRRLALRNLLSLADYAKVLEADPAERSALERDLLIGVTSFFRDAASFATLKRLVFPRIVQGRPRDSTIRIWVPGCATGEEAYSIAMLWDEYMRESGEQRPIQIFASDVSETAIERARAGNYAEGITADVSPERLERHFSKIPGGYRVNKSLRELCVFSRHNLIDDPPFSKLDLISCRNVLIYLRSIHDEIFTLFHYALRPGGFLFLGRSEAVSTSGQFSIFDTEAKIYSKKGTATKSRSFHALRRRGPPEEEAQNRTDASKQGPPDRANLVREVDHVLLSRLSPSAVVVDDDLNVIETRGRITPYLRLPTGKLSFGLLTLIPEIGFYLEIERLVEQVKASGEPARGERIPFDHGGVSSEIDVDVLPIGDRRAFLVIFETVSSPPPDESVAAPDQVREVPRRDQDRRVARLERELTDARRRLLTIVEEHQTSKEESQNATEEALSTGEELQSLNEELETAKEELQSTNEELISLNQELQTKNAALADAGRQTKSIVETVRESLLVLDASFRILSANRAFRAAFGVSSEEVQGRRLGTICGGAWRIPTLGDALKNVLTEDAPFRDLEIEQEFPRVGRRSLLVSGCRLDGLESILIAIHDATDRKNAEVALRKSEEQLRQAQKMEAIGRLAGGVAHDFNNLLTVILGYSALLLDAAGEGAESQPVREIHSAAERASALTKQLLAFSRRQVLRPRIIDIGAIVADLGRVLRRLVDEQVQVVVESSSDLWRVVADPGEIGRAVMNLCLNARDAMPAGGTMTIRTANLSGSDEESAEMGLAPGRWVLLSVEDTGVGMDAETKSRIFEPFFTTKEMGKGTGLGLATVLGIVEQSGGAIRCESSPGRGSRFEVYLPAAEDDAEPAEKTPRETPSARKDPKEVILLVEDEASVRKLGRVMLEAAGYVVIDAPNGEDGLSLCESHDGRIDLLVTDVMMPGLGGRELVERAKKIRRDMKVLFISGHTEDILLKEGIRKGMPFLQKPFKPSELARTVREVLDSRLRRS